MYKATAHFAEFRTIPQELKQMIKRPNTFESDTPSKYAAARAKTLRFVRLPNNKTQRELQLHHVRMIVASDAHCTGR